MVGVVVDEAIGADEEVGDVTSDFDERFSDVETKNGRKFGERWENACEIKENWGKMREERILEKMIEMKMNKKWWEKDRKK